MRRAGARLLLVVVVGVLLCSPASAAAQSPSETPQAPAGLMPDQPVGEHPTSRYEIWYSPGGFTDVAAKVLGLVTELAFGAVRAVVSVATWVITWAYGFRFAAALAEPAGRLAVAYDTRLVGPVGLGSLALLLAVVYAGVNVLRSRLSRGVGELLVSLLVLALGGMLLTSPAETFRTGIATAASLSSVVLELAVGGDAHALTAPDERSEYAAASTAAIAPLVGGLREAFVAQPHDLLNWGEVLTGPCAAQREQILAEGPHGTEERPRELMAAGGPSCQDYVAFNERPTVERLLGAGVVLVAALIVLTALVLVAVTVVVAQLVAVALVAVMPFAVIGGVLPGAGRQVLWRWLTAGLQCVVAVVAMAGLLTFMLITSQALLSNAQQSLLDRLGLLVMVTVTVLVLRKRVLAGTRAMAANLDRRLEAAGVGGTHGGGWVRPAAVGGVSGFGVAQLTRDGDNDVGELRRLASRLRPATGGSAAAPRRTGGGSGEALGGRLGRAGRAAAAATGKTAKTAANLTVNLPRAGPRAAARATLATSEATAALRAHLRAGAARGAATGREWREGLTHPLESMRREQRRLVALRSEGQRPSVIDPQTGREHRWEDLLRDRPTRPQGR